MATLTPMTLAEIEAANVKAREEKKAKQLAFFEERFRNIHRILLDRLINLPDNHATAGVCVAAEGEDAFMKDDTVRKEYRAYVYKRLNELFPDAVYIVVRDDHHIDYGFFWDTRREQISCFVQIRVKHITMATSDGPFDISFIKALNREDHLSKISDKIQ